MTLQMMKSFREELWRLEREIGRHLKDDPRYCGVTLAKCRIIVEIQNIGQSSLIDLANILAVDASTLSRHIDEMIHIGLVNKAPNPRNRRSVSLTLTEQGQKVYRSVENLYNTEYARVFESIPREKRGQVLESLRLFIDAVSETGGTADTFDRFLDRPFNSARR